MANPRFQNFYDQVQARQFEVAKAVTSIEISGQDHFKESPPDTGLLPPDLKQIRAEHDNLLVKKQSLYLNFINDIGSPQYTLMNCRRLFQNYREQFTLLQAKYL